MQELNIKKVCFHSINNFNDKIIDAFFFAEILVVVGNSYHGYTIIANFYPKIYVLLIELLSAMYIYVINIKRCIILLIKT